MIQDIKGVRADYSSELNEEFKIPYFYIPKSYAFNYKINNIHNTFEV